MSSSISNKSSSDSLELKISSPISIKSQELYVRIEYNYNPHKSKNEVNSDDESSPVIYDTSMKNSIKNESGSNISTKKKEQEERQKTEKEAVDLGIAMAVLNEDDNPEVITKSSNQTIEYKQGKYLRKLLKFYLNRINSD